MVAPVGGTVGDIPVRVGDLVTTQTLLTTLDDNTTLEAYIDVPTERAATLKLGTLVEIVDAASEVVAPSEVSFVSPRADPATQMVLVKASVDNRAGRLRAAQFVRVRIVWRQYEGPTVPVLAVQRRAGQAFVWVVSEKDGALDRSRSAPSRSERFKDRATRSPAGCRRATASSPPACKSSAPAPASPRSPRRRQRRLAGSDSREGGRAPRIRALRGGRGTL